VVRRQVEDSIAIGFSGGLPFGLEISGRPWHDGNLLGYAYAYEQATHHRHPPVLIEQGMLTKTP